jgi:aminobenzoyl-glutamate transport protein
VSFLDRVEKVCSKIPEPVIFFLWLMLITIAASVILSIAGTTFDLVGVKNGVKTIETHSIRNVLSADGIRFILTHSITKISSTNIMPILIMSIIGLGIAEGSGYIKTFFISILGKFKSSGPIATALLLFFGTISNVASDAGYLILVPMGAIIFAITKRNPMLGAAVAFAGVSGGFTANLFLAGSDALLAGISTTAARLVIPGYTVSIQSNYYFSIASTFVILITGFIITEVFLVKRFKYDPTMLPADLEIGDKITPAEKKALRVGNIAFLLCAGLVMWGIIPDDGVLRNPETRSLWQNSALSSGIIMIFSLIFAISGLAYGITAGTIKSGHDVVKMFTKFIQTSAGALGLVIFAYQFLNILEFTKIGIGIATLLVGVIQALNFTGIPFVILIILAVAFLNLFIGGMSSKWIAISYIIIPTFVGLGYTPEFAQATYRIGDSITNIISPGMSYMPIILAVFQKYKKDATLGTIISMMFPFTVGFFLAWSTLLCVFLFFNIPLGPEVQSLLSVG